MDELPGALAVTSTFPFVGRSAELKRLRTLLPRAEGEERRIVLIGGEAGSGKSRLVREFAAEAAGDGALVLYGAGDAVVRTPYGPFVEALEQLVRALDADDLREALGTGAGELARLLPDLAAQDCSFSGESLRPGATSCLTWKTLVAVGLPPRRSATG